MNKIFASICLSFLLFACSDSENVEVGNKTEMEVQSVVDAGKVMLGEIVHASFNVKNTGDYPLILAEVKGSCTCTVAEYPKDPIAPGESATIKANIKTERASPGTLSKEVRIVANTDPSTTSVLIKANVIRK
jgi:hypothetical protein